jgi:hypothetical protein
MQKNMGGGWRSKGVDSGITSPSRSFVFRNWKFTIGESIIKNSL